MSLILENEIKVCDYKCFGREHQGFDRVCPINLIIGRNNAGKSTLLDLISFITSTTPPPLEDQAHKKTGNPEVIFSQILDANIIKSVFPSDISGGI